MERLHWVESGRDQDGPPSAREDRRAVGARGAPCAWHELLSKFQLKVEYIKGSTNIVADGLSRWAYLAGGAQDVCGHGSKEDGEQVKKIEEEEACVFVVRRAGKATKRAIVEPEGGGRVGDASVVGEGLRGKCVVGQRMEGGAYAWRGVTGGVTTSW